MTTSESKGRFFTKRIDSHNESNRELACSTAQIGYVPTSDINWTRLLICILIQSYPQKMDNRIKLKAEAQRT